MANHPKSQLTIDISVLHRFTMVVNKALWMFCTGLGFVTFPSTLSYKCLPVFAHIARTSCKWTHDFVVCRFCHLSSCQFVDHNALKKTGHAVLPRELSSNQGTCSNVILASAFSVAWLTLNRLFLTSHSKFSRD